jgi:hypothetical protein
MQPSSSHLDAGREESAMHDIYTDCTISCQAAAAVTSVYLNYYKSNVYRVPGQVKNHKHEASFLKNN